MQKKRKSGESDERQNGLIKGRRAVDVYIQKVKEKDVRKSNFYIKLLKYSFYN